MQYYFILGINPELSIAEIKAVLERFKYEFTDVDSSDQVYIIKTTQKLNIEQINQQLGGTIKIGQIMGEMTKIDQFTEQFLKLIKVDSGKLHFGFSLYSLNSKIKLKKFHQKLRPLAMEIKRILREEQNLNSRWVVSKEPNLSSVIVKKNQLLKYGSEFCFFIKDKKIIFGQTLAVQLFEEFGQRDYTRPGRDELSGMLPPKLAKIMLNLAKISSSESVVLDPFCGSGTIIQEALLTGYINIIASDISAKAIKDTESNLNWLKEKYSLKNINVKMFEIDARKISDQLKANSIDYIITEPYLGPPLKGNESEQEIKSNITELENLYIKALQEFYKIIKDKAVIVIIFPQFIIKNKVYFLQISDQIKKIGYKKTDQQDLIYQRPNQKVIRTIRILQK